MPNAADHFAVHPHDGDSPLELRAIGKNGASSTFFYPREYASQKDMQEQFYRRTIELNECGCNTYTPINPIRPEFRTSPGKGTTKDGVARRTKIMVDLDRKCNEAKKHPATRDELS